MAKILQMEEKKEHMPMYALMGLIVVLLLISIAIQISDRNDNLTSWATLRSTELHTFFADCKGAGGSVDVRPNSAPQIIFMCQYADRVEEYFLRPGK